MTYSTYPKLPRLFDVEIVIYIYIYIREREREFVFLIYHGNMWLNLKFIQWVKNKQKHSLNTISFDFK
jgi:hypothetical protein